MPYSSSDCTIDSEINCVVRGFCPWCVEDGRRGRERPGTIESLGRRPLGCLNTAAAGSAQPCSTCRSPSRPPTEARSTPAPPPAKAAPPSPASRRAATRNLHAQKLAHRPPPLAAAPPAPRRPSSRTRPPPARVPLPPLLSSTLPLARRRSSSHPCFMRLAGRGRHRRSSPVAAAAAVAAA